MKDPRGLKDLLNGWIPDVYSAGGICDHVLEETHALFRVQSLGCRVQVDHGVGCRVQGLGFGFRVSGLGCRV